MESRALSPDLRTSKIYTIHLASKCPWPNISKKLMKYIPKSLTLVENNQNFMTYYLKGDYTTQWEGSVRRQTNSPHNHTLKGQDATAINCSKGNSVQIEGESLFTTGVVKHWMEQGSNEAVESPDLEVCKMWLTKTATSLI